MIIGVDASRSFLAQPTGTETYSKRLIQALLDLDTPHRLRLYLRSRPPNHAALRDRVSKSFDVRVMPFPRLWTHGRLSWEMATHRPDALFVPAHVLPLVHPPASVVTVHDLGYLTFPAAHPVAQRLYLDLSTRWNVRAAAHLIADSLSTKSDLLSRYGLPISRVTVAYPGIDAQLAPVRDREKIAALLERLAIRQPYFLYLGTLQPRKNLARLLEAFAAFDPAFFESAPSLVIAGKRGWLYEDLHALVRRLRLERQVLFPGYIEEDDKPALLSGAIAFLFPSLYEGFGMPVVEAQACGCPVVTSATSSLPEASGGAALLVDPLSTVGIRDALHRIVTDAPLRRSLIERGFANVRRFSWKACAETVLHTIERTARSHDPHSHR